MSDDWKYIAEYPADEWSEEADAIEEARQAVLTERVYRYLARRAHEDGFFRLDTQEGFDWIARAAVDPETSALFSRESEFSNYDDETWILFSVREDVELALRDLADEGRIEWVIRDGWPWILVPNAARDLLDEGSDTERYAARVQRIVELQTMPYREYLTTPEWKARRQIHLSHAGHRCQLCNSEYSLHVHHRTYQNRGNERFTDLIVLCATCHQNFHDKLRLRS